MYPFDEYPPVPPPGSGFCPESAAYDWQDTTLAAAASNQYSTLPAEIDSAGPANEHDSNDGPSFPPLGSSFYPEPAPYDWQHTTHTVASAGYPILLEDSAGPPDDAAAFEEDFAQWINTDMLSSIVDDALQAAQSQVAQSATAEPTPPHHDSDSVPAQWPAAPSPPAPTMFPSQERAPLAPIQHRQSPSQTFSPALTAAPEPPEPPYPFGPPYHTPSAPRRGTKRGRGSETGPRTEGRTSKRPRSAGSSHPESGGSSLGPVRTWSPGPGPAPSPAASVVNDENTPTPPARNSPPRTSPARTSPARRSPARSPLRIWSVSPTVPLVENRSVLNAAEDRAPLGERTNTPPSSTVAPAPAPAPAPLPTRVQNYIELAGYPENVRDLSAEFYEDIKRVGAELASRRPPPATSPVAPAPSSPSSFKTEESNGKGKGKAAVTEEVQQAEEPKKKKTDTKHKYLYFCPLYTPPNPKPGSRSPGDPRRTLFTVENPNIPGAAPTPRIEECTPTHTFARKADALRHLLFVHVEVCPECNQHEKVKGKDGKPMPRCRFNRTDSIKRHIMESKSCMDPLVREARIRGIAERLGLHLDTHSADPTVRAVAEDNRAKCVSELVHECTLITMPCYQEPAVRAALGAYMRLSGKSLAEVEMEQRRRAAHFKRHECEDCAVPKQEWAEEWQRGRVQVPVWYGEVHEGMVEGVTRRRPRRNLKVEEDDEEEYEDEDQDDEDGGEHDEDRFSPEPEEGVDEDDEAPSVALYPATVARPVVSSEPTMALKKEESSFPTVERAGPSSAHAVATPAAQVYLGHSRPARDTAPPITATLASERVSSQTSAHPEMESPLEVYQRLRANASDVLAAQAVVGASIWMSSPPPDDSVTWGEILNWEAGDA